MSIQQHIYTRCDMWSRWVDKCTVNNLKESLPGLIKEIYSISNRVGWSLTNIEHSSNPREYEIILRFLSPTGALFRLIYKLLCVSSIKYSFHLSLLPVSVRQSIEDGTASRFYMEKLVVDPRTRHPMHLALNPLELYMFHFMFHVVSPQLTIKSNQDSKAHLSVYLRLAEEYLCMFLPCDGPTVQPQLANRIWQSSHRPLPQNPVCSSQLFKKDVQAKMLRQSPVAKSLQTHASIWCSELVVVLCRDMWLSMTQLPNSEHLGAVRLLVKHWHYFANSRLDEASSMEKLKKVIIPSNQQSIYQFIRCSMRHWPMDSSFKQILEIWLSYIQPWRYVDFDSRYNRPKGESSPVDTRWSTFISENLVVYSVIFHQLIDRFTKIDLASPRNAYMLFRLTKVFSQPNLPQLLRQAEGSELDSCNNSKLVQWNSIDLEEPDFIYKSIFQYDATTEVFMRTIEEAEHQAVLWAEEEAWQKEGRGVWKWFWPPVDSECKNMTFFRTAAYNNLASLLQIPTDFIDRRAMTSPEFRNDPSSWQLTTNIAEVNYEGDPDLQPIRSFECGLFVRQLYQLCCWINCNYEEQLTCTYMREDVVGGVARQVLRGPQVVYFYDKSVPGVSTRISTSLPPRLSLRWLANLHLIIYFPIFVVIMKFALGTSVVAVCAIVILFSVVILIIRSYLGFCPRVPVISVDDISEPPQIFNF